MTVFVFLYGFAIGVILTIAILGIYSITTEEFDGDEELCEKRKDGET